MTFKNVVKLGDFVTIKHGYAFPVNLSLHKKQKNPCNAGKLQYWRWLQIL